MARKKRKAKQTKEQLRKERRIAEADPDYQYFHLSHTETAGIGEEVERKLAENGVIAEKTKTISGCLSFRWKRDAYDLDMLNSITFVIDYAGIIYIQKPWVFIAENEQKQTKKRRRRRKNA